MSEQPPEVPRANRATAVAFLQLASGGKAGEAFAQFVGSGFRHHNPYFAGDAESLKAAMLENAAQFPHESIDIKHVVAENDLVAVHAHVRLQPNDPGMATIHLFRFEGDRIVELWDLGQPISTETANQYGMF